MAYTPVQTSHVENRGDNMRGGQWQKNAPEDYGKYQDKVAPGMAYSKTVTGPGTGSVNPIAAALMAAGRYGGANQGLVDRYRPSAEATMLFEAERAGEYNPFLSKDGEYDDMWGRVGPIPYPYSSTQPNHMGTGGSDMEARIAPIPYSSTPTSYMNAALAQEQDFAANRRSPQQGGLQQVYDYNRNR